ncbi:MAG TPA: TonB family protein [Vicinamibacteria bacterium]|nr:TonB family protein [Vicinamibacteria bacterium]
MILLLLALVVQDWNEALRREVRDGRYDAAERLLENPAVDPNAADEDGFTPLMYAARSNRPELVNLLTRAGAALNLQNNEGETALIVAVRRGRVDAARLLLMAGSDESVVDKRGRTALDWAEQQNRLYLAQIIRIASEPSNARVRVAEQPLAAKAGSLVPPRVVHETPPLYTESAFDRGIEGRVVLKVIVRKDGTVGPIRIHQSLEPGLDAAAVEAVRTWSFEPARIDDEPINVLIDVEIDFTILRKS